jgi:hypothetical protein
MSTLLADSLANRRALWFVVLCGPITWSIQFLIGYGLSEALCTIGANFTLLGLSGITILILAVTVIALVVTIFGFLQARRMWRDRTNGSAPNDVRDVRGTQELMLYAGMWLNGLFAMTILLSGVAAILLRPC